MTAGSNETALMLTGPRALVTGGNSGIGEAVAKGLAAAGASVAVNYVLNENAARQVVNDIAAVGGTAYCKAIQRRFEIRRHNKSTKRTTTRRFCRLQPVVVYFRL